MNAEERARAAGIPIVDFDPECDPAFKEDPLATILAAQQLGDVLYSTAARGFWVITRHEVFKEICQDPEHYSNRETFTFYRDPPPLFSIPPNLDPPEHTKVRLGRDPGPSVPRGPTFLYVSHDPDAAWADVGANLLHAANSYARWIAESDQGTSEWYPPIASVDELRAGGAYQIVTPDQCVAIADQLGRDGHLILRPLFGGTEPKNAWANLRLFETEVLPHLDVPEWTPR